MSNPAGAPPLQEMLTVVVNGQSVQVHAGPVRDVIAEAIERSGQISAPISQWELRTPDGDVIPHNLSDGGDWILSGGKVLFLNLGLPPIQAKLNPSPAGAPDRITAIRQRLQEFLNVGGFFNPEHMERAKSQNLFIDVRDALDELLALELQTIRKILELKAGGADHGDA